MPTPKMKTGDVTQLSEREFIQLIVGDEGELKQAEGVVSVIMWRESDRLFVRNPTDDEYGRIALAAHVTAKTLKERANVARAIPPEDRNPEVSFSVHKAFVTLVRDPEKRRELLHSRDDWTIDSAREAVRELRNQNGGNGNNGESGESGEKSGGRPQGFVLDGWLKVTGRSLNSGQVELLIHSSVQGPPIILMDSDNEVRILFKPDVEGY